MEITATLDQSDLNCIHDILNEIVHPEQHTFDNECLLNVWNALPDNIKGIAYQWGLSDSVFRDDAYVFLNKLIKETYI